MSWPSLVNEQVTGEYPDSTSMKRIMKNLQANILKPHGRNRAYHIFLRFKVSNHQEMAAAKDWIERIAQKYVTSAQKQFEDSLKRKENPGYSGGLLGCFFLSVLGYNKLFPTDEEKRKIAWAFRDHAFEKGMKKRDPEERYEVPKNSQVPGLRKTFLNKDPMPADWEGFYKGDIHALLLLAQDCRETKPSLEDTVYEIIKEFGIDKKEFDADKKDFHCKRIVDVCHLEYGQRILSKEGYGYEHFGFRDGISNPNFFKDEIERKRGKNFNPGIPIDQVLVEDRLAKEDHCFGSYFVFRKLEQDVDDFKKGVKDLLKETKIHSTEEHPIELTEAQIVGRFKDGTPVMDHSNHYQELSTNNNDFTYEGSFYINSMCPPQAHIRRVNPRKGNKFNRPLVRRGIPYGKPGDDDVGMLFMCYQSSIDEQFEFIQRVWIDDGEEEKIWVNEVEVGIGQGPLVGQDRADDAPKQWWFKKYEASGDACPHRFGNYVTLKGGEYFFAPSLRFLQTISEIKIT